MKIHWIYEIIFTFVIKACKCTIPTQYQIWIKNSPIFLILKTNNNKTITKMWNLKLWNTTNTNSNKIIGIFAKKGPIYCSQYYCQQIMTCLSVLYHCWLLNSCHPPEKQYIYRQDADECNSMKQACPSSDFLTLVMNKYLQTLVK